MPDYHNETHNREVSLAIWSLYVNFSVFIDGKSNQDRSKEINNDYDYKFE